MVLRSTSLVAPLPSFENEHVQAVLKRVFPAPTFKIHVVHVEKALLLKLAEHELDSDCCGCLGLKAPSARTFEELSPATATHQWTLGIDGNTLTCVRKCGDERFDAARDGIDLEQESVNKKLPEAVAALRDNRWFLDGPRPAAAPAASAMPALPPKKEVECHSSWSSTQAPSSHAPASVFSHSDAPSVLTPGDAAPQLRMAEAASAPQPSVADELRKLAELVREGVLTDAEFQSQKKKLLAEPLIASAS